MSGSHSNIANMITYLCHAYKLSRHILLSLSESAISSLINSRGNVNEQDNVTANAVRDFLQFKDTCRMQGQYTAVSDINDIIVHMTTR